VTQFAAERHVHVCTKKLPSAALEIGPGGVFAIVGNFIENPTQE
jgi:hypothetical protein